MSTFLHVHVPIFLLTGIEYIHEKSASLEKYKKKWTWPVLVLESSQLSRRPATAGDCGIALKLFASNL